MVAAALVATVRTQEAVAQEDEAETVVATFTVHYRVLAAAVVFADHATHKVIFLCLLLCPSSA